MKIIFKILPILIAISCKAQTLNIEDYKGNPMTGAYYKDINNIFDPFVGTWQYTNGNSSFKIVLEKRTHSPYINQSFDDLLVGEYEYKINNVVRVSTLSNINNPLLRSNNINAKGVLRGGTRACRSCPATDIFINGGIIETVGTTTINLSEINPNNPHTYYGEIFMKRITVNGQPAIEFTFYWSISTLLKGYPAPPSPMPAGTYVMIKQ